MRKLLLCAVIAFVATIGGVAIAAESASDSVVGTWRLNVAKSTFTSGPALKSQMRMYSQSGQTITLVMKTVGADGKEVTTRTTYQLDGKDYPVKDNPDFDSLAAHRVDSNTTEFNLKRDGKPVGTTSRTVSKDGKTLTTTMKLTTAGGEEADSVLVFDKQ